eukprot:6200091-Pleurochrysis_carterae.AAC.1
MLRDTGASLIFIGTGTGTAKILGDTESIRKPGSGSGLSREAQSAPLLHAIPTSAYSSVSLPAEQVHATDISQGRLAKTVRVKQLYV